MTTANELLMGGGAKSAKFDQLNVPVVGTIVEEPKVQQMKKYQSEEMDFWPSGDPKMQIIVTVQTDQREDDDDDGRRILFIPPRMMPPVRDAIAKTGAKGLAVGGRIAVSWVSGTGQGKGNPKVYAAEYQPPQIDVGSLLAQPAPTVVAPASLLGNGTTPANADQSRSAPPTPPPGIDPAKWATLSPDQQAAVIAAMPPF